MGLLYFEIDDIDRPTPPLDIHSKFHHYDHPGDDGNPTSYAEALWDRPEVDLVIAADRDPKRLAAYGERGEMVFDYGKGWRLWQQVEAPQGPEVAELDWPAPVQRRMGRCIAWTM